jgi:hypothetical protein
MPDDLNDDATTDGGALRKQYEQALKDLKAANDARAALEAQVRITSVKEMFAELKANPKGAKFYNGEPTKEALAEWLKGDGDIFATAPEPPAQTPGEPAPVTSDGTPLGYQLPPGIDMSQLQGAQALAANPPAPPAPPTGDLDSTINKLSGLSFDKPEDVATLTAAFQGLRSVAATRLAQGGTL